MNSKKLLFLFFLFFSISQASAANIIFDMDGVLVTQKNSLWHIGPFKFLGLFNPIRIGDSFFDFLDSLMQGPKKDYVMHKGRVLPQIFCDWQKGLLSSPQMLERVTKRLQELSCAFDSKRKAKLIGAIARLIFTPERFIKIINPVKKGIKILKKCYEQLDAQGNRVNKIFILTNWADSFLLLYDLGWARAILEVVDGFLTSEQAKEIKPNPAIYHYAFEYFGIDPDTELTVYIDDEITNIKAARSLNKKQLKCIHCNNFDFASVDKSLRRLLIYKK